MAMENAKIKVSVIMPVFNAGEYLSRAAHDVLAQSLEEIELICIDDGSTDDSVRVMNEMQRRDGRVKIITGKNEGASAARNKGLLEASGEYVIFLDADDFYEKDLLKKLYNTAVEHSLDIAVTKFDIYNEDKDQFSPAADEPHSYIFSPGVVTSKGEHPQHILQSTSGYVWNKLFRMEFLRNKEITFDPELYVFEDVYFVSTAISLAERVERIDDVLIHHRVYSEQSRARLFRKYYSQVPVLYKKIKDFLMRHGMYIPLAKSYLNLSATRCFKIYNLLWADGKERFWNTLHKEYAEEFGWYRFEKEEFDSPEVYEFVANVGLYTYSQYTAREQRGEYIDIQQLDREKLNKRLAERHKLDRRKDVLSRLNVFRKNR
jgi:glycosyltransferase involved in cell wall biosynthesis